MAYVVQNKRVESIAIDNFYGFKDTWVNLHPRMTVITGRNGSGKTSLIRLMASITGVKFPFLRTTETDSLHIRVYFDDKSHSNLVVVSSQFSEDKGDSTFSLEMDGSAAVHGCFISSHRNEYIYTSVESIPTYPISLSNIIDKQPFESLQKVGDTWYTNFKPLNSFKRTLISWAVFGFGNRAVTPHENYQMYFERLEDILRKVLPEDLGFFRISVRSPDVFVQTKHGDYPIDSLASGLSSIIDIVWSIFIKSLDNQSVIVAIDEPENHLHAEMQRSILPSLLESFPQAQFVVTTHSALVSSSVRDSFVYALESKEDHRSARLIDQFNRSGTADDIYFNVMNLETTRPKWSEEIFSSLIKIILEDGVIEKHELEDAKERLYAEGIGDTWIEFLNRILGHEKAK